MRAADFCLSLRLLSLLRKCDRDIEFWRRLGVGYCLRLCAELRVHALGVKLEGGGDGLCIHGYAELRVCETRGLARCAYARG